MPTCANLHLEYVSILDSQYTKFGGGSTMSKLRKSRIYLITFILSKTELIACQQTESALHVDKSRYIK